MSRKQRKQPMTVIASAVAPVRLVPASAAGECVMCKGLRALAGRQNYTEIYAKRGEVRYCRCKVCNYTWKVIPNGNATPYNGHETGSSQRQGTD